MSAENSCNMWVFREGRRTISGKVLLDGLRFALRKIFSPRVATQDALVDALLRAGELECALTDAESPYAPHAARITDAVAAALVECPGWPSLLDQAPALLDAIVPPASFHISPPEGFAYYALHPLDFVELANRVPLQGNEAAVVGIRSIGTTLSAVVTAALRRRGVRSERITVRPVGHPYDRRTTFSAEQLRWITWRRTALAEFVVVDEGPGISGSSFLSVGDALLEAGAPRERISIVGSRCPDPCMLTARNGAARWQSFRTLHTDPTTCTPPDCGTYLGGGEWRRSYAEESQWPASWVQMERLKFLSQDGKRIYKFDGLGRFGEAVAERARLLGDAGFGGKLLAHSSGFSEFEVVNGRPMDAAQVSSAVLERVADYCVLRALEFSTSPAQQSQLEEMVRFNIGEEFGCDPGDSLAALHSERLVIADGRMLPHEWLATSRGALLKTDNATHGDDHFFPGPVDIAWDLAGAIVEWGMTTEAARYMLDRYYRRSGDDARGRMDAYLLAYAVFRMAYCGMAAFTMRGSAEEPRLRRAAVHYRSLVEVQLEAPRFKLRASGDSGWIQRRPGVESVLALGDSGADAA